MAPGDMDTRPSWSAGQEVCEEMCNDTHTERFAGLGKVGTELLEGFSGGVKALFQSATFRFVSHGRMLLESFLMICKK